MGGRYISQQASNRRSPAMKNGRRAKIRCPPGKGNRAHGKKIESRAWDPEARPSQIPNLKMLCLSLALAGCHQVGGRQIINKLFGRNHFSPPHSSSTCGQWATPKRTTIRRRKPKKNQQYGKLEKMAMHPNCGLSILSRADHPAYPGPGPCRESYFSLPPHVV